MFKPITFALFVLPVAAFAADDAPASWSCQNTAAEISCGEGACEVTTGDGFTAMSVSASTDAAMSLCAYTGCWEGRAQTMTTTDSRMHWTGTDLRWSHATDEPGVARYRKGDWDAAIASFGSAMKANPADALPQTYIERCRRLKAEPPADWKGVWVMTSK